MSTTEVLVHLVGHYDDSPLVQGRRIEDLCRADEGEISSAAAEALRSFDGSRGFLHLLRILSQRSMIQPVLLRLAAQDAKVMAEVTKAIIASDPLFDTLQLLRNLVGPGGEAQSDPQARANLLAALAVSCQKTRLFPIVSELLKKTDAAFNSRAVLSIGRAAGAAEFLFRQTENPDPRVCANAIEALWEHEGSEVEQLLQKMRRRGHQRIVANALIGLYRLGSLDGLRGLVEMGRHPSAAFRASGAWAMGFLADARFTPILKELLKEPTGPVRRNALMALQKVQTGRQTAAKLACGSLELASLSQTASGAVNVRAVAWDPEDRALLPLRATQWSIQAGGLNGLLEYSVESCSSPPLRTAILAPFPTEEQAERLTGMERALEAALSLKRTCDGLAVFPYRPLWTDQNLESSQVRRDETPEPEGPEAFWRPWRDPEIRTRWLGPLMSVLRRTVEILARHRGPRHVVLVVDGASPDRPSVEQLLQFIGLAGESGVTPHIALIRDADGGMGPQLEAAILLHSGWLAVADGLDDLQRCLSILPGGLALHYRVEFQPPAVPPGLAPPPSIVGYLTSKLAGSLVLPLD